MDQDAIRVEFEPSGRGKARCARNPDYPGCCHIDVTEGRPGCSVNLPYPAPECGEWIVLCAACGMCVGVTAAGRPDDPRSVHIPCKGRVEAA
jgi:hypothetical protein